ncbi:rhamnosyltransferase [Clostridium pascui]|uniref:glycosyltransferase family 2 protein n=1 Tax=Clostridium pascui TaxID=46609 RepID=UPI0019565701|nr:glycosyltransferase family 2 protein [Clostridium pascui]MBM7869844.1 rhamnosyltransferase [Clostridium pascui]
MSTYNGEKYIREQINSILNQIGDFELDLWVRDDGSSDSTKDILEEYSVKGKLKWYTGKNLKPAHSFLDLVKHCVGYDFYAFADQDDFWMPDKIQSGILMIEREKGPALYCSNAELVDSNLRSLGRAVYKSKPRTDFETLVCAGGLMGCTMIFNNRLSCLVQGKDYPEKIILHDFYLSAVCAANRGRIFFDPEIHMKYRQHEKNVVGVSSGFLNKISRRLFEITHKNKVCISEQAHSLILLYGDGMKCREKEWLNRVAEYQNTIMNRLMLALSHKTCYSTRNAACKLRVEIMLGNR